MKKFLNSLIAAVLVLPLTVTTVKANDLPTSSVIGEGSENTTVETSRPEWQQVNGNWYLKNSDGTNVTGWYKDEKNCWYLLDYNTGVMKKGWVAGDSTHWYYFNPANGIMQTGWQTIDGQRYYLETSGYYAGSMVSGDYTIDGTTHSFASNGVYQGTVNNTSGSSNTSNSSSLSASEILAEQQKIHDNKYPNIYADYSSFKGVELNLLKFISDRFDKTETIFLPMGDFDTDFYQFVSSLKPLADYLTAAKGTQRFYDYLAEMNYSSANGLSGYAFATSFWDIMSFYEYDPYMGTMKKYVLSQPHDETVNVRNEIANGADYTDYFKYMLIVDVHTGETGVIDYEDEKYCVYNVDGSGTFNCYDANNREFFIKRGDDPKEFKRNLLKTETKTNKYLQDRVDIKNRLLEMSAYFN